MLRRYHHWVRALSTGAITLGFLQAWQGIDFSSIWASLLTLVLSALVSLFLGAGQLA